MAEGRVSVRWIRHHMTYSWWKYLLAVVVCVFGVNLLFTMTAYRPPEEKKIELYVLNDLADAAAMQAQLWPLFQAACPDQEELSVVNINLSSSDPYVYMQFSTYVAARQGDVCLMPESEVVKLAADGAEGAFADLGPYVESGVIDAMDIDLSAGMFADSAGVKRLYAIPADSLYGLLEHGCDPKDSYLVLLSYNGNDENAAKMLDLMLGTYHCEKPAGYDEKHKSLTKPETIF